MHPGNEGATGPVRFWQAPGDMSELSDRSRDTCRRGLAKPSHPFLSRKDDWHAVVYRGAEVVGCRRDDGESLQRVATHPILPPPPTHAEGQRQPSDANDRVGLLAASDLLPLIERVYRHDAALAARERVAE